MISKRQTGNRGESIAQDYLRKNGYQIVVTNWRCPHGEIDIVAQHGKTLVFVEVRTRRTYTTETAFASITPAKQHKLRNLAYAYLNAAGQEDVIWRVDVIAVALSKSAAPLIDHVEDALGW